MRRSSLLFLCAALAPGSSYLAGCFTSTSGGGATTDGGLFFGDSSFPQGEGGVPEASLTATLSTTPVDFGLVDCGGAAVTKTYTIKNTGAATVTYSATATSIFSIQGASSGSVASGETGTITLALASVPATSTAGTAITGTLTVTTDVPGFASVSIPLTVTPQGGSLTLTPALVGFGQQEVSTTSSPLAFALKNVGNASVSVAFGAPSDPEFAVTGGGSVAAGATLSGTSATFTPSALGDKTATAAVNVTGALCASPATSVPLSGTGTGSAVNIGPSPLDFGTVACGSSPAPQAVTITNSGGSAVSFTAALGLAGSSPFSIDTASGPVPGGGSAVIHVTPKAFPLPASLTADAYDDTLTVGTSANGTPLAIPLKLSATGALVAVTMPTTDFGTVQSKVGSLPFTITNTGDVDAPVSVSTTGTGYAATLAADVAGKGGGTAGGTATFTPSTSGPVAGTLLVATTAPQCGAPLQPIDLTATGAVPVIVTGGTPTLTTPCGSAGSQGFVTLQNTGSATATISVTGGTGFNIVSAPTTVAPGTTQNVVIQGVVPSPGTTPGSDTPIVSNLTITTNELTNPVHTVAIKNTVTGANLGIIAPVAASTCGSPSGSFGLTNSGNATVTLTGGPRQGSEQKQFLIVTSPFDSSGTATLLPQSTSTGEIQLFGCEQASGSVSFGMTVTSGAVCLQPPALTLIVPYAPAGPSCTCE